MQKQLLSARLLAVGAGVSALAAAMAANTGVVAERVFCGMAAANGRPAMRPVRSLLPL